MPISENYSNQMIDFLLDRDMWVALYDGDPKDGGTELSGDGYERVLHTNWAAAAERAATNTGEILWPAATDDWEPITYVALYDAAEDGDIIGVSLELAEPVLVLNEGRARIQPGVITVVLPVLEEVS